MTTRDDEPLSDGVTDYAVAQIERGVGLSMHLGWFDGDPERGLPEAQAALDTLVIDAARLGEGQAVLDVACGLGGTLSRVALVHPDAALTGLDAYAPQLEAAQRATWARTFPRLTWCHGDACALPFAPASFDRVLCVEAAFHFRSRALFFAEVARVLRPGGRAVVVDILGPGALPSGTAPERSRAVVQAGAELALGLGPWPDPFCEEGTLDALTRAAGLVLECFSDLSAGTQPSYTLFLGPGAPLSFPPPPGLAPMPRALTALGALQRDGHLRYVLLELSRAADRESPS